MLQQRRRVVRGLLEAEWPLGDIRRVSIALLLEGDDLAPTGQHRQDLAERRLDGVAAAVQQYEWRLRGVGDAVNLEIEAQAVDGRVASPDRFFVLIHVWLLRGLCGRLHDDGRRLNKAEPLRP
ncbi:hypothetical protein D9M70_527900 [compost metagenome]